MNDFKIRPAETQDFQSIIQLNQAAIQATAPMDLAKLQQLNGWSDHHQVVVEKDQVIAFLLVLGAGQPYQSLNYQWFDSRYPSYYYVDRIVVATSHIGRNIGGLLYQDLFNQAKNKGLKYITCEYNIQPMNMTSHRFHQKHGFNEVATQWLDNNQKQVSLQVAEVI